MRPVLLLKTVAVLAFFALFQPLAKSCGVEYVGSCATTFDIVSNGQTQTFQVGGCSWLTAFDGKDFGTVTEFSLAKLQSQTWESCTNRVRSAQFFYRIYPSGQAASGVFQQINLSVLAETTTGAYRNKTYTEFPSLDLLATATAGTTYVLEVYFRSDVDANDDGTNDSQLLRNNAGLFFKATFKKSGTAGGLTITFPTKTNPTCAGLANGKLTAAATGGTAPYTFLWSNGATTAALLNLPAGPFSVTATAANGATGTASATLVAPAALAANASAIDETNAAANNGTATAAATGGTQPYLYSWSNGATTATISNLDSGNFTVTATDSKSCTAAQTVTVAVSGANPTNYCASSGSFPWQEWVSSVKIGTLDNPSGKAPYSNFTALAAPILTKGDSYLLSIGTSGGWFVDPVFYTVWIDFDRNGSFSAAEKVLSKSIVPPVSGFTTLLADQAISIPTTADEGATRMRVAIKRTAEAGPCEAIPFGEVEDYTVQLAPALGSCSLTPTVTAIACQNNNTPSDPSDDKFTFSLAVAQVGATGTGWTATVGGTAYSAAWGVAKTVGPLAISAGNAAFSVKDAGSTCSKNIFVTAPATCSNTVNCSIFAAVTSVDCQNNGTTSTGADDKFTFTMNVTATGGSASGWTATVGGQAISGSYGLPKTVGPFDISGGVLTFSVRDAATATCTFTLTVAPPQPCSVTGGPTGYCVAFGTYPWEKWISKVQLGAINKASSKWTYTDYTSISTDLVRGQAYPITVSGSFSWNIEPMHVRVWVDANRDGVFNDATEAFFSGILQGVPLGSQDAPLNGTLTLPATASAGATRMRVAMKQGAVPGPCEGFATGEVEDYTINILAAATLASDRSTALLSARKRPNSIEIELAMEAAQPIRHLRLDKSSDGKAWQTAKDWGDIYLPEGEVIDDVFADATPFDGLNFYRLAVGLDDGSAFFSATEKVIFSPIAEFSLFPNPATDAVFVDVRAFEGLEVDVQIIHPTGKTMFEKTAKAEGDQPLELSLFGLPDGEFFVLVRTDGKRPTVKKLLIQRL